VNPTIVRVRAVIGAAFAVIGLVIGGELLAKPAPLNQKLLGLAFSAVLVALGVVRVRAYWMSRR
jgi:hypothetical protein